MLLFFVLDCLQLTIDSLNTVSEQRTSFIGTFFSLSWGKDICLAAGDKTMFNAKAYHVLLTIAFTFILMAPLIKVSPIAAFFLHHSFAAEKTRP